jgi:hypothetical protein
MKNLFRLTVVLLALVAVKAGLAADTIEGYYWSVQPSDCFEDTTTRHVCHVEQGLNIKRRNDSNYYVWIHTEGNYGHFCSYRAVARVESKKLVSGDAGCKVFVEVDGANASISTTGAGCDTFCGANVGLDIGGLKKRR